MNKHKMKRPVTILIGFLAAIGIVAAIGFHHFRGGPEDHAERMVDHMEKEFKLDADQTLALHELKSLMLQIRLDVRANRDGNIQEVMGLMSAPTLDQQRALAMVETRTTAIESRAPEVLAAVANFTDRLTPEQKQEMQSRFEHKMEKWRRWHE